MPSWLRNGVVRSRLEPVGVIIQASMATGTVPGLLAEKVCGKSYLEHQLDRVLVAFDRSNCVVVITELWEDRLIEQMCLALGVPVYVGDRDDALGNCMRAARRQRFRSVMILRSDCPLIDPKLLMRVRNEYLRRGDPTYYFGNRRQRTYPVGMEVEITGVERLFDAYLVVSKYSDVFDPTLLLRRGDLGDDRVIDVVQASDQSEWRFRLDTWQDHEQLSKMLGLVQDHSLEEVMRVAQANGLLLRDSGSSRALVQGC
jgi:spore coat polysaccharide biosynthesis protein SpsF